MALGETTRAIAIGLLVGFAMAGLAATLVSARRVAKIDPMRALRNPGGTGLSLWKPFSRERATTIIGDMAGTKYSDLVPFGLPLITPDHPTFNALVQDIQNRPQPFGSWP